MMMEAAGRIRAHVEENFDDVGDSFASDSPFHVSQINLNDRSVEGLRHRTKPIETVQYHPEGAPGPLDALAVFDRFVATMTDVSRR